MLQANVIFRESHELFLELLVHCQTVHSTLMLSKSIVHSYGRKYRVLIAVI